MDSKKNIQGAISEFISGNFTLPDWRSFLFDNYAKIHDNLNGSEVDFQKWREKAIADIASTESEPGLLGLVKKIEFLRPGLKAFLDEKYPGWEKNLKHSAPDTDLFGGDPLLPYFADRHKQIKFLHEKLPAHFEDEQRRLRPFIAIIHGTITQYPVEFIEAYMQRHINTIRGKTPLKDNLRLITEDLSPFPDIAQNAQELHEKMLKQITTSKAVKSPSDLEDIFQSPGFFIFHQRVAATWFDSCDSYTDAIHDIISFWNSCKLKPGCHVLFFLVVEYDKEEVADKKEDFRQWLAPLLASLTFRRPRQHFQDLILNETKLRPALVLPRLSNILKEDVKKWVEEFHPIFGTSLKGPLISRIHSLKEPLISRIHSLKGPILSRIHKDKEFPDQGIPMHDFATVFAERYLSSSSSHTTP